MRPHLEVAGTIGPRERQVAQLREKAVLYSDGCRQTESGNLSRTFPQSMGDLNRKLIHKKDNTITDDPCKGHNTSKCNMTDRLDI
eukprot:gene16751-18446_t